MGKAYGYMNIEARKQAVRETEIARQKGILKCERIFLEKKNDKVFDAIVSVIGKGDSFHVAEMSVLGNTAREVLYHADKVVDTGAKLIIEDIGEFSQTKVGSFRMEMLRSMAEFEKQVIAKTVLKNRMMDKRPKTTEGGAGRPRKDFWREEVKRLHDKQLRGELTDKEICEELGISRSSWYNKVKENGLKRSV